MNHAQRQRTLRQMAEDLYRRLDQPIAPVSRLWRYGLLLVVAIFCLTTLVQSLTIPVFEGIDEQRHYAYARYLVNNLTLPPRTKSGNHSPFTYGANQESGQPPLYYLPVALLTTLAPNADDVTPFLVHNTFVSPSEDAGMPYDNHNSYLHGAEGRFPFQGVALAVHLARLASIAIGACTLLLVFAIARILAPSQPGVGLLATALIAAVPGFLFLHSVISNDVAVILFVALSVWCAMRILRDGPTLQMALVGGLAGGLATLSKVNGAWAAGIVWAALIASAFIHRRTQPLLALLPSLLVWLVVTGWWFAFGLLQNNDPLGIAIHAATPSQTPLHFIIDPNVSLMDNLITWDHTTWYAVGWSTIFGPEWVYQTFRYLYLLGIAGAIGLSVHTIVRLRRERRSDWVATLQAICLVLVILFAVIGGLYWQLIYNWRLGRLLYPGLTVAAIIAALGYAWWLGLLRRFRLPRPGYWLFGILIGVLLQRAAIFSTANTIINLLPHGLLSPATLVTTPTQVTFLDPSDHQTPVASVTGFQAPPQDLQVGNAMYADLCWKSAGYTGQSFPYSMQLVGPNDYRAGTRNSYHGLGSYPLIAWKNGETFCDATSLYVAQTIDRPRAYNLVVTLFQLNPLSGVAGPALDAIDANGRPVYPVIGRVRVGPAPGSIPAATASVSLGDVAGVVSSHIDVRPGNLLSVTVRWVALQATGVDAKVFMHALDPNSGQVIAQSDHQPDDGWFPTNYWLKGDVIDDHFEIQLPAGANPLTMNLQLGMYDALSQVRLAATNLITHQRYQDDAVPIPLQ